MMIYIITAHDSHITWTSERLESPSTPLFVQPLIRCTSKETIKLRVASPLWGSHRGNSPVTTSFHSRKASNAKNVSMSWRHHESWTSPASMAVCAECISYETLIYMYYTIKLQYIDYYYYYSHLRRALNNCIAFSSGHNVTTNKYIEYFKQKSMFTAYSYINKQCDITNISIHTCTCPFVTFNHAAPTLNHMVFILENSYEY